jgi:hypothetical protein
LIVGDARRPRSLLRSRNDSVDLDGALGFLLPDPKLTGRSAQNSLLPILRQPDPLRNVRGFCRRWRDRRRWLEWINVANVGHIAVLAHRGGGHPIVLVLDRQRGGSMSEFDVKAQLSAIEYLLGNAYRLIYASLDFSPEEMKKVHAATIERLREQSLVKTDDPVLSDHYSGEVCDHVERFLKGLETLVASRTPRGS